MKKIAAVWICSIVMFSFIVLTVDVSLPVRGATTITVDDSGGADYTKIQDAINASNDGDTVFVYGGTYYENVLINKTLNLTGENRDTTIINGSGSVDSVLITADFFNGSELYDI
jgi:pectin methylesterase-like acyl-CoA thioesterase